MESAMHLISKVCLVNMAFASNAFSLLRSTATGFGIPTMTCVLPIITSCSAQQPNFSLMFGSGKYDEVRRKRQVAVEALTNWQDNNPANPINQEHEVGSEKIRQLTEQIQKMLQDMEDGKISVSPYDTAWVALVEVADGRGRRPQFPTSLNWISTNQLADGSWGDRKFLIYDRILNTLACVVALTAWQLHPQKCQQGMSFIRENLVKLETEENKEQMPIGFEVTLPSLIDTAKKLGIQIPVDSPAMKDIYARRDIKLRNIPMDLLHKKPTSLLFSLEGMEGLDWEKLFRFREVDGSFLSSPSSTAYALSHTKDELCLQYLLKTVNKFNGGVPNVYPVDMFEHMWSVDRLQRLGISRFFQAEIEECVKYVYRYWKTNGISWARNSSIEDIDETSTGFRLLRLHGYDVSIDAFKQFEKGGEFCCILGQATNAITGMYNLYRVSQLRFPQEHILTDAKNYSANFLHKKRLDNEIVDKWIITKDLLGEVEYALDVPFYASLPRLEARFFLEQYGGADDVWIGKTLYRMLYVNCDTYLELAKLDYRHCQAVHQSEWTSMRKWYRDRNLGEFGLSERSLLLAYYIAASTVFEPEKSGERMAWAKTAIVVEMVTSSQLSNEQKGQFIDEFSILSYQKGERYTPRNRLVEILINTITLVAEGRGINHQLLNAWIKWLKKWGEGSDLGEAEAALLLQTLHSISGLDESSFSHPKYHLLIEATCNVCHQLRLFQNRKKQAHDEQGCITRLTIGTNHQIEAGMQEVVKLVFSKTSEDLPSLTKQSFFDIARSFYYTAYCNADAINSHIDKVLFGEIV